MKLKEIPDKTVVHTPTEDEAKELLAILHENGYKWLGGYCLLNETNWECYTYETKYRIRNKSVEFGGGYYGNAISPAEFKKRYVEEEKPQSQFQEGDKVVVVTTDYNLKDVVGGIGVITKIMPHGYHIKSLTGEWFVKDKDIMPYSVFTKENPKPKFKLGDKVKVLYSPDHQGKISVVESVIRSTTDISPYCYALSGLLGTFFEKCIELYTEPEAKDESMETKDGTKEAKKLNLCELLDNGDLLCSLFYSPAFGEVSFEENRTSEGEIEIETKTEGVIFVLDQNGRIANEDGVCILFPSRALYEQYPLDAAQAWDVWKDEHKRTVHLGVKCYFNDYAGYLNNEDNNLLDENIYFRTPADRDKCIEEIKKIIDKHSK